MYQAEEQHRALVRFSMRAVENKAKSLAEGRPIYEDVEYVEIQVPGDKSNIVHKRVTDEHRQRFAPAYNRWKQGHTGDGVVGTRLSEWPLISRSRVEELAYFSVHTVEQLAAVSDGNLQNIGPLLALRQLARDTVEAGKQTAPLQQLREELERLKNDVATKERLLQEQAADLAALKAKAGVGQQQGNNQGKR